MVEPRQATPPVEVRVLVRPPDAVAAGVVTRLFQTLVTEAGWSDDVAVRSSAVRAPHTSPARHDILVHVESGAGDRDTVVSRIHELVQLAYDAGRFLRVEADVPTVAFDPTGATTTRPPAGPPTAAAACPGATDGHDWALEAMRVPEALDRMAPETRGGRGIVVGHPDSGYSDHPMLGRSCLDLARDRDVISGDDDARDLLRPPRRSWSNPLPNPGHGTSTASVITGRGESGVAGGFGGVAPAATLVPIRATESVVQVFDSDVAEAVRWARHKGCHIVSMSLGGKGLFGLQDAVAEAVGAGMIVMAAAGNQVGFVTAPASYDNCLAIAATTVTASPWSGSSRGRQVTVSAPGACVWAALFDWDHQPPAFVLGRSNGTSYAVAHTAGVVALWLAHHGHQALVDRFGAGNLQALLVGLLRRPGVCQRPDGWDGGRYGAGIIDAFALLEASLPAPHEVAVPLVAAGMSIVDPLDRLAASADLDRDDLARILDALLGPGASRQLGLMRRFEGELAYHLADPESRRILLGADAPTLTAGPRPAPGGASPRFLALLAGASTSG